ncbi:phenylalanyl-tRNA synthetase alpha chain [Vigna unguiculata]|uniref:Phenylalanyl-tRNA synthetase alpha chain n=1 Tax=Vigna unguiculata TaxID=3917 RepID=A0A4D6NQN0_VIGUN|nr:phenylalanyl-tRNA synthetase alpha chain [Vigna unguiculata]
MCKRCGNMRRLACSSCKGTKSIREGGLLGMKPVKDLFETLDHTESQVKQIACVKCEDKAIGKCIGLAKHRDGRWELAIAPGVSPSSRYQHAANFDDVLIPEDHVSRSYNDTYYVDPQTVLRCHTSAHQAELLRSGHTHFLVTGDVYRRDSIICSNRLKEMP